MFAGWAGHPSLQNKIIGIGVLLVWELSSDIVWSEVFPSYGSFASQELFHKLIHFQPSQCLLCNSALICPSSSISQDIHVSPAMGVFTNHRRFLYPTRCQRTNWWKSLTMRRRRSQTVITKFIAPNAITAAITNGGYGLCCQHSAPNSPRLHHFLI